MTIKHNIKWCFHGGKQIRGKTNVAVVIPKKKKKKESNSPNFMQHMRSSFFHILGFKSCIMREVSGGDGGGGSMRNFLPNVQ